MASTEIMWLTSVFVVVAGVTVAAGVLLYAHYKQPKKAKKVDTKMAKLNHQIREGLRLGEDAPDHILHAIATTRAWVHKERMRGHTDMSLANALCSNGWEPDVARQLVTSTPAKEDIFA